MVARITDAVAAYANTARRESQPGLDARDEVSSGSFGNMVRDALGNAIETSRAAEVASTEALTGQADLADVVVAVNNAEMTLQTVVSIRDKVIQSYQEIMRMPI